jgi:hypothetical protein
MRVSDRGLLMMYFQATAIVIAFAVAALGALPYAG